MSVQCTFYYQNKARNRPTSSHQRRLSICDAPAFLSRSSTPMSDHNVRLTYTSFRTAVVETVSTKHGFIEVRSSIMSKPLIGAAGEQDKIKQSSKQQREPKSKILRNKAHTAWMVLFAPLHRTISPATLLAPSRAPWAPSPPVCTFSERVRLTANFAIVEADYGLRKRPSTTDRHAAAVLLVCCSYSSIYRA